MLIRLLRGAAERLQNAAEGLARSGRLLARDPVRALVFALILLAMAAAPPLRFAVATQSARMAEWVAACPAIATPQAFDPWRWAPCFAFAGASAGALRELASWLVATYCAAAWLWFAFEASGGCVRHGRAIGPLFVRARAWRRKGGGK